MKSVPALMIAGTGSDSGKTTVTLGIICALRERGLKVQPFKVGPDYIDPGHHAAAAGCPSHNLDGWMIPREGNLEIFHRAARGADVAVIEGVMGLFDGLDGTDESGSSAEMAGILKIPVILVVDASAMARSAAAVVRGFSSFEPGLKLDGVVFNGVGGPSHEEMLRAALASRSGIPCVGCLPENTDIHMDDRHLGLVTAAEISLISSLHRELARAAELHLDLDMLLDIAYRAGTPAPPHPPVIFAGEEPECKLPLAVAVDKAFSFYYQANLDLLEHAGAELIPFSPLDDSSLPAGARGLYIGGGYPEVFASRLAENRAMRECIAGEIAKGMPIFAECGGFMYLCRSIVVEDGREYPMVGAIPARAVMSGSLQALGYVQVTTLKESPLGPAGSVLRGHEYRWSRAKLPDEASRAYAVENMLRKSAGLKDGFAAGNIIAGYQHLHFAYQPRVALHFLESMRKKREEKW